MGKKEKKVGPVNKSKKSEIFILHGWAYETSKWGSFLEELKKQGIEGILLKIPGLTAPLETPWTLDDYVNWLHEQTKNKKQITLLGHSNGGRIALAYAIKYPDRIKQLYIMDSAGIYHKELFIRIKRKIFRSVATFGKKIAPESARPMLYKIAQEHDYERANPVLQETMKNLITSDLLPSLGKIQNPTIIIWGKKDKITPFKDALTMHMLLKNSKLFSVSEARHSPQFSHAAETAKLVVSHLK